MCHCRNGHDANFIRIWLLRLPERNNTRFYTQQLSQSWIEPQTHQTNQSHHQFPDGIPKLPFGSSKSIDTCSHHCGFQPPADLILTWKEQLIVIRTSKTRIQPFSEVGQPQLTPRRLWSLENQLSGTELSSDHFLVEFHVRFLDFDSIFENFRRNCPRPQIFTLECFLNAENDGSKQRLLNVRFTYISGSNKFVVFFKGGFYSVVPGIVFAGLCGVSLLLWFELKNIGWRQCGVWWFFTTSCVG